MRGFIQLALATYRRNKKEAILLTLIYLTEFFFLLSVPVLSGLPIWHYVPIVLFGAEALLVAIWCLVYKKLFVDVIVIFVFLFPLYCLITSFFTRFVSKSLTVFLLAILCIVLYQLLVYKNKRQLFLGVWFLALLSFAAVFLVVYFRDLLSLNFDRLGSAFNNVNEVGLFFTLGLLLSWYYLLRSKKWFFLLFICLFLLLGLTTGSKQFLLSSIPISAIGVCMFFGKKHWYLSLITLTVLAVAVIGCLQLPVFATIKRRAIDFLNFLGFVSTSNVDTSSAERLRMIKEAFYLFSMRPLFGYGIEGFTFVSYFGTYSHNTLAELLADHGLIGSFIFVFPFLFSVISLAKKRGADKTDRCLSLLLVILILTVSFSSVLIEDKNYYLIIALLGAVSKQNESIEQFSLLIISRKKGFRFSVTFNQKRVLRKKPDVVPITHISI